MRLSVCKVIRMRGGVLVTSYVYGPTAAEYIGAGTLGDLLDDKILSVEDVDGYKEEGGRRVGSWWEGPLRPTRYYFNKHLSREPISSGAGPYLVGASDQNQGESDDGGLRAEGCAAGPGGIGPGRSADFDGDAQ